MARITRHPGEYGVDLNAKTIQRIVRIARVEATLIPALTEFDAGLIIRAITELFARIWIGGK